MTYKHEVAVLSYKGYLGVVNLTAQHVGNNPKLMYVGYICSTAYGGFRNEDLDEMIAEFCWAVDTMISHSKISGIPVSPSTKYIMKEDVEAVKNSGFTVELSKLSF